MLLLCMGQKTQTDGNMWRTLLVENLHKKSEDTIKSSWRISIELNVIKSHYPLMLTLRTIMTPDDPWKTLADQAASQGISQQSIDEAQAALHSKDSSSDKTVWGSWIKGKTNEMGYTFENAPSESEEAADMELEGYSDIGVADVSPAQPPQADSPAPTNSPAHSPAPLSQAPGPSTPEPQPSPAPTPLPQSSPAPTPTPEPQSPAAPTPEVQPPTPQAQSPGAPAPTPLAQSPGAPTPEVQPPGAPTPVAQPPGAATPVAQPPRAASPVAQTPGAATPVAQAPGAATPLAQAPGAAADASPAQPPRAA
ncbi:LysM peptidoglycan-binding domain-containing protein [Senna tora]|uniref:LysM peptidoglycan-binding domain-containing protein n=1 Tax=Senna tora TaxID=362788 RepID=A0A834TYI1_9FABA|nr:LysM peptidoglycan-binding domain-containing protein [Senna tora]